MHSYPVALARVLAPLAATLGQLFQFSNVSLCSPGRRPANQLLSSSSPVRSSRLLPLAPKFSFLGFGNEDSETYEETGLQNVNLTPVLYLSVRTVLYQSSSLKRHMSLSSRTAHKQVRSGAAI